MWLVRIMGSGVCGWLVDVCICMRAWVCVLTRSCGCVCASVQCWVVEEV